MRRLQHVFAMIFPVPDPSEKIPAQERILLSGILVVGVAGLVYFTADWGPGFYWGNYSIFKHLNLYCPACGGSRSIYNLVRGNFLYAWRCNQLFILSLPLIVLSGFALLRAILTGYPITGKCLHPLLVWGYLVAIILFGILRNMPGEFFDCLRPPS
mgnify:FL=1|jgi:hypothetical protein